MGYADNNDLHFQTSLSGLVPTTAFTRCIQLLKIHTSKFILSWYFSQTQLPCLFTSLTTKRLYLLVPDEDGLEKHVIGFTLRPRIHRIENFKILVDELKKNVFVGTLAMQSIFVANKFTISNIEILKKKKFHRSIFLQFFSKFDQIPNKISISNISKTKIIPRKRKGKEKSTSNQLNTNLNQTDIKQ